MAVRMLLVSPGEEGQALVAEAVNTRRRAIAAGWTNARHTNRNLAFTPLRTRDDFRRLLAEVFDRGSPEDPFAR